MSHVSYDVMSHVSYDVMSHVSYDVMRHVRTRLATHRAATQPRRQPPLFPPPCLPVLVVCNRCRTGLWRSLEGNFWLALLKWSCTDLPPKLIEKSAFFKLTLVFRAAISDHDAPRSVTHLQ